MAERGERSGLLTSLHHRDWALVVGGFFTSSVGSWAYNVALVAWLLDRTGSLGWVAGSTVARFLPSLILTSYAGVLADRFERTRLMRLLDLTAAVLMGLLTAIMAMNGSPVAAVIVVALTSLVGNVYAPAAAAITPVLVPTRDLASANTLRNTLDNVAVMVGPALGGVLLVMIDAPFVVAVNSLTFVASFGFLSFVRKKSRPVDVSDGGQTGPIQQMLVGIKAIAGSGSVATLVSFSVLATVIFGTDTVMFPAISQDILGTGAAGYGYLLAGLGVGGILGAPIVARLGDRTRLGPVILLGMAVYTLPTLVFLVSGSPVVGFAAEVIRGGGTLVVDVLAMTALQRSVSPDRLGRVFGAFMSLVLLAILIGSSIVPPWLHLWGLTSLIWAMGLAIPVLCLGAVPTLQKMDNKASLRKAELAPMVAVLDSVHLFKHVSTGALEVLAAQAETVTVPEGTVVITEGDAPDFFYIIEEGTFVPSTVTDTGEYVPLASMEPGDYFGEIGLIEGIPRTATVTAGTDGTVLKVDGEAFISALIEDQPSPALLDGARARIGTSHPDRKLTFAAITEGDG